MTLIQYKLKEVDSDTYKVCWLDKSVEPGVKITLKGGDKWYEVIEKYNEVDSEILSMNRNIKWYSLSNE